eukprot:3402135-Pyramimonas_sp.AAC.1
MSPALTFALLAPVHLDPEFGAVYEGLRTVMRTMRNPEVAAVLRARFGQVPTVRRDGPVSRLRVLSRSPVFGPGIQHLMDGNVRSEAEEEEWLH